MYRIFSLLFLIIIPQLTVKSQIFPREGSKLNYRIIGFEVPSAPITGKYKIEIAAGNYNNADSFKKNIIKTLTPERNKIITEVPSFGMQYTWRSDYLVNGRITYSALHHFSTLFVPRVDTNNVRLSIIHPAEKYKGAYVFLDGNCVLYDMAGHPVWFLPDIDGLSIETNIVRDLKLTPQGTISFIIGNDATPYEINYNGTVLWKPTHPGLVGGDSSEHYHHEFTRLSNGHYMVMGSESVPFKLYPARDSVAAFYDFRTEPDSFSNYRKLPFGTLIEYDQSGNVVWSWRSSQYFKQSDIHFLKKIFYQDDMDVHANAFFFDEKNQAIYVSFRNINRVVKIKYPQGTVTNVFGEIYGPAGKVTGTKYFSRQHSCKISKNGDLYVFDNNIKNPPVFPRICVFHESLSKKNVLEKKWEYECNIDGIVNSNPIPPFTNGGNVIELDDNLIFCSMPNLSKIFIVNRSKKTTWSAVPEKWNATQSKWDVIPQYRASIIESHKDLERLIMAAKPGI